MVSNQINLDEYIASFLDGDGSITTGISINKSGNINICPSITLTQSYIGGLFDTEGCISCQLNLKKRIFNPRMFIGFRKNESHILNLLKEYLLTKGIKTSIYIHKRNKKNWEPLVVLYINGYYNVKRFLDLIYPYCIIKKNQMNIMLNEILPRIRPKYYRNNKKYSKKQIIDIMHYVDKMRSLKGHRKNNQCKYNEKYFRDLWNIYD